MNSINDFKKAIIDELINKDYAHFSIDMCSLLEQVCKEYFSEIGINISEETLFNKIKRIAKDVAMDNLENFSLLVKDRNNIVHQRINYSTKINESSAISILNDYNKLIGKIRYRHRKILANYKIEINHPFPASTPHDYEALYNSISLLKEEVQNLSSKLNNSNLPQKQEVEIKPDPTPAKDPTVKTKKAEKPISKTSIAANPNKKQTKKKDSDNDDSSHFVIKNGVLLKYTGHAKKVVLPKEVKEIGETAFYRSFRSNLFNPHTASLEEIDLRGITKIGNSAFKGCINLKRIVFDNTLQTIGEKAFYGCKALDNVTLPNSLTVIERHAFDRCEKLKSIILPDNLTYLGFDAFCFCTNLEYVHIGKNLRKQINFSFCNKIKQFDVSDENKFLKSIDGNIYSKDGKTLICCAVGDSDVT